MRRTGRLFSLLIALALTWVGAFSLTADLIYAHAEVAESNPAEGAAVPLGLREITIRFTEDVSIDQATAEVIGPGSTTLEGATASIERADRRMMRIATPPLSKGDYTVKWRVVTEDDNAITNGEIHFSVTDQPPTGDGVGLVPILLLICALLLAPALYLFKGRRSSRV